MSTIIKNFLDERKNDWLKKKIKDSKHEQQKTELTQAAEKKFSLEHWLPDAAKRAKQLLMVSHPGKFTHPSAKVSAVMSEQSSAPDGYLRSGNVSCETDVLGNAAALDVYKFLMITMDDGQTILAHLEADSPAIKASFDINTASYEQLKLDLMAIKHGNSNDNVYSDRLIKQVYFPVADDYHLLSILAPSGLMVSLKKYLNAMRFSETTKLARECWKKNEFHADGFDDIYNLTFISYGGSKRQNISVLNNQHGGKFYLLASVPPKIEKRQFRLPRYDFFKNILWIKEFKESFLSLHRLARCPTNNMNIRQSITNIINFVIDSVLDKAFQLRSFSEPNWSKREYYQALPRSQKIWLDNGYQEQRENENDWFNDITEAIARWIIKAYEDTLKLEAIKMGDGEWGVVKENVAKADIAKEFLK